MVFVRFLQYLYQKVLSLSVPSRTFAVPGLMMTDRCCRVPRRLAIIRADLERWCATLFFIGILFRRPNSFPRSLAYVCIHFLTSCSSVSIPFIYKLCASFQVTTTLHCSLDTNRVHSSLFLLFVYLVLLFGVLLLGR